MAIFGIEKFVMMKVGEQPLGIILLTSSLAVCCCCDHYTIRWMYIS